MSLTRFEEKIAFLKLSANTRYKNTLWELLLLNKYFDEEKNIFSPPSDLSAHSISQHKDFLHILDKDTRKIWTTSIKDDLPTHDFSFRNVPSAITNPTSMAVSLRDVVIEDLKEDFALGIKLEEITEEDVYVRTILSLTRDWLDENIHLDNLIIIRLKLPDVLTQENQNTILYRKDSIGTIYNSFRRDTEFDTSIELEEIVRSTTNLNEIRIKTSDRNYNLIGVPFEYDCYIIRNEDLTVNPDTLEKSVYKGIRQTGTSGEFTTYSFAGSTTPITEPALPANALQAGEEIILTITTLTIIKPILNGFDLGIKLDDFITNPFTIVPPEPVKISLNDFDLGIDLSNIVFHLEIDFDLEDWEYPNLDEAILMLIEVDE